MNRLYIRHAVGSMLLFDTEKHGGSYELEQTGGGWKFTIGIEDADVAELLLRFRDELNLFVIPEDNPNQKYWFYSRSGALQIDMEAKQAVIIADSRIDYTV